MNEQEKAAFEKEIREKIAEENREKNRIYKAKWCIRRSPAAAGAVVNGSSAVTAAAV